MIRPFGLDINKSKWCRFQEIINNFAGKSNHSTTPFPNASSAFYTYNGQANYNPLIKGGHHYEFRFAGDIFPLEYQLTGIYSRYGDVAYFVLDTRLYRSGHVVPGGETKTMLGERQLSALYEWLDRVNSFTHTRILLPCLHPRARSTPRPRSNS